MRAMEMLAQLYQVEPGDAVCGYEACMRFEGHGGAHLNYLEYEAFLLHEADAEREMSDGDADAKRAAEMNWSTAG